jgi:EXS family
MSSTQEVGPIFGEGEGPAHSLLRSPTVIILSIGLWGMNIYFFRLFKLDYVHILNLDLIKERQAMSTSDDVSEKNSEFDQPNSSTSAYISVVPQGSRITGGKCVALSFFLLFLLHMAEYLWVGVYGGSSMGAIFIFYSAVCFAFLIPLASTRWIRIATALVFQRTFELFNPRCSCIKQTSNGPRPIPFIDVFYADAMCSLSKVFFDWGMLFHMAVHYPNRVPKSLESILIPSFCAAIPYLIRARQCIVMYIVGQLKHDSKRYQHALNALKYCSSIFPICLSAYQQTLSPEKAATLERALLVLLM